MSYDVYWVKNRAEKITDFEHPTCKGNYLWRNNLKNKFKNNGNKNHESCAAGRGLCCAKSEDGERPDYEVQHYVAGNGRQVREPVCGGYARQLGTMQVRTGADSGGDAEVHNEGV